MSWAATHQKREASAHTRTYTHAPTHTHLHARTYTHALSAHHFSLNCCKQMAVPHTCRGSANGTSWSCSVFLSPTLLPMFHNAQAHHTNKSPDIITWSHRPHTNTHTHTKSKGCTLLISTITCKLADWVDFISWFGAWSTVWGTFLLYIKSSRHINMLNQKKIQKKMV